jgi:xylulokinase
LYDAWEQIGTVTVEAAGETGLAAGTPVFAGADDATPVAITTGSIKNGQCFLSIGSAGNICANTVGVVSHPTCIFYPHCVPQLNLVCTVISSMGASYKWMRSILFGDGGHSESLSGDERYERMNREAQTSRPGAGGIIFLPYLEGDYTPHNDVQARGVFIGMDINTTQGDMLRAVMEGTAMAVLSNLQLIEKLGEVALTEIIVTGGPTKSNLWMQTIADITACSISLPEESEGAPFGNAIIAGVGAGLFASFDDAVTKMVHIDRHVYTPNPANRKMYDAMYGVFSSLYANLAATYASMAEIKQLYT